MRNDIGLLRYLFQFPIKGIAGKQSLFILCGAEKIVASTALLTVSGCMEYYKSSIVIEPKPLPYMLKMLLYLLVSFLGGCNFTEASHPASRINQKIVSVKAYKDVAGIDGPLSSDSLILLQKIKAVYKKAKEENYNMQYALLADLGVHSGSKRLYLVNLAEKKVLQAGLVTHGSSNTYLPNGKRRYSNANGSLCSSLGLYKIGGHYQGQFGLAYKLYGLSKENSNAYARAIVLHSHSCVPVEETAEPICQSWGCPTVAPAFLQVLGRYIDAAEKPMLLYMFDSTVE